MSRAQTYICVSKSKNGKLSCVPIDDSDNKNFDIKVDSTSTNNNLSKNCTKCQPKGKITNISNHNLSQNSNSNKRILPIKNVSINKSSNKKVNEVTCPNDGSSGNGIFPIQEGFPGGNPVCPDGSLGYRIEYPTNGSYNIMNLFTVTITTSDETTFSWSASTPGVTQVVSKGGTMQNVYNYSNLEVSDTCLRSPINSGGNIPNISHLDICYNPDIVILYGLKVEKTAVTQFNRSFHWNITKTSNKSELILAVGQTYPVNYTVDLTSQQVDSNWKVSGTIIITNTNTGAGESILIENVTDTVNTTAVVTCPVSLPFSLAPGGVLICTYDADLPNNEDGINTANVYARRNDVTNNFFVTKPWDFNSATITEIDKCVTVSDDRYGSLGSVCANGSAQSFSYTLNVGLYDVCDNYVFENTATLVTNTNYKHQSASHSINISVPCSGCTLTPGYWKTHSKYGPAPYDDTWDNLEDTIFFLSNSTYYNVLWNSPAGNAYYILSSAWIAATLNVSTGASVPNEVQSALVTGKNLFIAYTPGQILVLKGSNSLRQQFINNAKVLDDYNNGIIGPGHCSL